jgi:cytochrome c2
VGGRGGRRAPRLDDYARYIAPIVLAEGMWNHGSAMRQLQRAQGIPMPRFSGREIADIQAYLRRAAALPSRETQLLQPPDPNRGRRLFSSKRCAHCHGARGAGTRVGPSLRSATERLRVSEIAGELWNHSLEMAQVMRREGIAFPRLREGEMADVIAFLYYLRFYDPGGDLRTGERLFVEKGCATCHAVSVGEGGGPNLARVESVLTPLGLATAMWDHAPAMYDLAQLRRANWPRFEGDEMRHLSVYLRTLAEREP